VGLVSEIEDQLAELRGKESSGDAPVLRTSTMTHLVWAPPSWLAQARATLAGLHDRHPARTIFLVPEPRRAQPVTVSTSLHAVQVGGSRDAFAEVIEIRLRGSAIQHPASIVLPLLIADLPVFCRWRGEPEWDSQQLVELTGVADRLVFNSSEWRSLPEAYERLVELTGWLRSRLKHDVQLTRRNADAVTSIRVDGIEIPTPIGDVASGSDLLSAELDVFGRDRVYEAAVRAA
jgi:glucose-6-phosphate dehydrogenase assembly protein OpcA